MLRNKTSTSMQKTYDECYLICSTAIYFEGQKNEPEALRSWRSALDRIYYHNAYRVPANYRPASETERALQESLHAMERQCKERVTLLEAERDRREEAEGGDGSVDKKGKTVTPRDARAKAGQQPGWHGNGNVPSTSYFEQVHAPLPTRPAAQQTNTTESTNLLPPPTLPPRIPEVHKPLTPNPPPVMRQSSRTPSPEKKGRLKTTLRDGKGGKKSSKPHPPASRPPAASKAAGLAWDYKRTPSSSTISQAKSSADHRESLSEQESGRRSSRDSSRHETLSSPPLPPPHVHPPSVGLSSSSGHPAPAPTRPERMTPVVSTRLHSDVRAPEGATEGDAARKKAPPERSPANFLAYRSEYPAPTPVSKASIAAAVNTPRLPDADPPEEMSPRSPPAEYSPSIQRRPVTKPPPPPPRSRAPPPASKPALTTSSESADENTGGSSKRPTKKPAARKKSAKPTADSDVTPDLSDAEPEGSLDSANWEERLAYVKKHLPKGIDPSAAKQIFNEIVVQGDEVHWSDIAGLEAAKKALKEAVVYPFLRPDLFMGLREPARGMLLFGPPGTGKTMLARAVATESRSTFFAISASSLTSKWLGDSEKLVRALFGLARALAPSIIFVDEIDSLLSARGGSSEHESTRRIKTEFLIQWSDLQRAAAGKDTVPELGGDPTRVLVLAATNMPWAIDDAARRRFVRRQYIPLPERPVRAEQLRTLFGHQKHDLDDEDLEVLVRLTDGYSGSDITALAKDAAMGPLRSLGEALLQMTRDEIRPIRFEDFEASLVNIRPSVSANGLKEFEDWARDYGERGA